MKQLWLAIGIAIAFAACTNNRSNESTSENAQSVERSAKLITHAFKVDGLQDSLVHDSIWRIIFDESGVDKLILTKEDSMAIFTINPDSITLIQLEDEIVKRGGLVLN